MYWNIVTLIKRILKIGGPHVDLVVGNTEYYPSEWIRGELFVTAPNYQQNIESITINLKEFWVEFMGHRFTKASRYRQHGNITVVENLLFLPRMKYQFPFEIQLPHNCRVSSEEGGWRLGVVISDSSRSVVRADFHLNVRFSKVIQTIIEVVEKDTKFSEISRGRKFIPDTSATRLVFRPPVHLLDRLRYFMLDLYFTEEDNLIGKMYLDTSKSSSMNRFKNDMSDIQTHEFEINYAQLFNSEGRVQRKTVAKFLSDELTEALSSTHS
ncbi:MAG: sporulation protein [Acidobacteriota bacterium]